MCFFSPFRPFSKMMRLTEGPKKRQQKRLKFPKRGKKGSWFEEFREDAGPPGDSIRGLGLGGWWIHVTLFNGFLRPPTGGWKGHLESPGNCIFQIFSEGGRDSLQWDGFLSIDPFFLEGRICRVNYHRHSWMFFFSKTTNFGGFGWGVFWQSF